MTGEDSRRWWKNEDWLAVLFGLTTIAVVLVAIVSSASIPLPKLSWGTPERALGALFTGENLKSSFLAALVYAGIAGLAVAAMGGNVPRFFAGFPIVYLIAWLAQAIAGHKAVTD